MIAVSSSGKSFKALGAYLVAGRSGEEQDRIAWSASRNLPTTDPQLAATIMRATADRSDRVQQPVYHVAISFDPHDTVDQAAMERVADHVLARLGLAEHQALIVAHRDRPHPHFHLFVNRVHPKTGRAWERWQDQPIIQQALREQERALGLREVPGRLGPEPRAEAKQTELDLSRSDDHATQTTGDKGRPAHSRERVSQGARSVANDLRTHSRIAELSREQYAARVDADAARARVAQLEAAVARARVREEQFVQALASVYRTPNDARRELGSVLEREGVPQALDALRKHPERYGELIAVPGRSVLSLLRRDDGPARKAAWSAARKGALAVAADRALWATVTEVRIRQLEAAVERELRPYYRHPEAARAAVEQAIRDRGPAHAITTLSGEQSLAFGAVRSPVDPEVPTLARRAQMIVGAAQELVQARDLALTDRWAAREATHAAEYRATRDEPARADERERAARRELSQYPPIRELEYRISRTIERLMPHEIRQLKQLLTAPQVATALKLSGAIREIALGRDQTREA